MANRLIMKKLRKLSILAFALILGMAFSANSDMRIQKKDNLVSKNKMAALPDLVIQNIKLSGTPKQGDTMGSPAFVSILINNASRGPSQATTLKLQCRLKSQKLTLPPKERNSVLAVPALLGGKSAAVLWPKPSSSLWIAGDYTLTAVVDDQNKIPESNEKNNTQTYRFSIAASQVRAPVPENAVGLPKIQARTGDTKDQREKNLQPALPVARREADTNTNRLKFKSKPSLPIVLNASPEPGIKVTPSDPSLNVTISEEALCREYAREAVDQYHQAETNMCGFQGGAWHNDFDTHYDWCLSAGKDQRKQESDNRKKALKDCGEIKRFDNPRYLGLLADFCLHRRVEIYSSTPIEGEVYNYDFGWTCGVPEVAESYCLSQGYDEMVEFKVADNKASENTMPLGNRHRCDASVSRSNCRGFDYIICRRPVPVEGAGQITAKPLVPGVIPGLQQTMPVFETKEAFCREYAETAVQQYHEINNNWCSLSYLFEPWRWHGNMKEHYDWCLTATPEQQQAENDERLKRMDLCAERERKRFYKPMYNGKRVDIHVNFQEKYGAGEPDVPQRAADLFCQEMGYEKAIPEWLQYYNTFSTENLDNTIHLGEGHPECNTDWPSFNDKCEAFSYITCERPAQP